jgi:hypothetical protein
VATPRCELEWALRRRKAELGEDRPALGVSGETAGSDSGPTTRCAPQGDYQPPQCLAPFGIVGSRLLRSSWAPARWGGIGGSLGVAAGLRALAATGKVLDIWFSLEAPISR